MKKLQVFLSSAQYNNELITEREGIELVFEKSPVLSSFFELWKIESGASPTKVDEHYINNVKQSDILILILGQTFRDAVVQEYDTAVQFGKPIFAYIKKTVKQEKKLNDFIKNKVFTNVTPADYYKLKDLVKTIEDDLQKWIILPRLQQEQKKEPEARKKVISTEISRDEKALRLLSGIVFSQDAEITQKEIFENIIIATFLKAGQNIQTRISINKQVNEVFTITQKSKEILNKTINSLIVEGKLNKIDPDKEFFTIDKDLLKTISSNIASKTREENHALQSFFEGTYAKSIFTITEFIKCIDNITTEILTKDALLFAQEIFKKSIVTDPYNKQNLERMITETIIIQNVKGGVSFWYPIIHELFTTNNSVAQTYLVNRFKSYFILLLLNLDPDCTSYEVAHLKNHSIFIDSHIALRAMVNAGGDVDICRKIISEHQKRGIKTYISEAMFNEIHNSFKFANDVYLERQDIDKVLEFYKELKISSDVFDGYLKMLNQKPDLSWNSYINIFWSPTRRDVLKNFIELEMGIEVYIADHLPDSVIESGVAQITSLLLDIRRQQLPEGPASEKEIDEYRRHLRLRHNEASLIVLIYLLRNKAIENKDTKEIWFLTFDTFVYKANSYLAMSDKNYAYPCYYKPARWLEMLSLFADQPTTDFVFKQLLLSEEIQRTATLIESEVLYKMLQKRVDNTVTNIQTLIHMFKGIVNRPAIQDAYEEMLKAEGVLKFKKGKEVEKIIFDEVALEIAKLRLELQKTRDEKEEVELLKKKEQKRSHYYKKQFGRLRSSIDKSLYKKKRSK